MLQILGLALLLALPTSSAAQPNGGMASGETASPDLSPQAQQVIDRIWQVLQMDQLMPVLRDEAMAEAPVIAESLFPRGGTGTWTRQVAAIHDPKQLEITFREGLANGIREDQLPRLNAALDFYQTPLGARIITLETTARQTMLNAEVEEEAVNRFAHAAEGEEPRSGQIMRLIEEADLVGPNVAGGLNAAVAFSEGFSAGGGFDMPMTRDEMLADAWSQEADIAAETLIWMQAYLMLAYSPLSDAELEQYIRYSTSPEGRALANVMFHGFDKIFIDTSRALGLAAARQMQGREL